MLFWMLLDARPGALAQSAPYTLYGPSEIDLSMCSVAGPEGEVTLHFWVMRQPAVTGPAQVSVTGLPSGVSVKLNPATLDFTGGVVAQLVTATFTMTAGVTFPDQVVWAEIADGINRNAYGLILHGTCPRHNKDFLIKGSFFSNYLGVIVPVSGAIVEIYRDVAWQVDQHVWSVRTDRDGNFEARLSADEEDTYYAKLRLNDGEGVYLRDWWTSEIKDFNSVNRGSNRDPVIDLGATVISRDDGASTPKTLIWQGGRAAFQEFIEATGTPPPTGDYEIVIQNTASGMVWTARSTTNWEDTWRTGGKPQRPGDPFFNEYFSQFKNYRTNFHEFGHALRHTVDGDQPHFMGDAARWTYARGHTLCGSNAGYVETEAYAFNEGWAEYWSGFTREDILAACPTIDITDMTIEGAVVYDLVYLADTLRNCLPVAPLLGKAATMKKRQAMFSVLNRGDNIMHSQGEFRSNYQQQFPQCGILPPGVKVLIQPSAVTPVLYATHPDRARFMEAVSHLISSQEAISAQLKRELSDYPSKSGRTSTSNTQPASKSTSRTGKKLRVHTGSLSDTSTVRLLISVILKGKLEVSQRLTKMFKKRLYMGADTLPEKMYSAENIERMSRETNVFSEAVKKVTMRTMQECVKVIRSARGNKKDAASTDDLLLYFERKVAILKLKTPINDDLYSILELPPNSWDDTVSDTKRYDDIPGEK